MPDFDTLSQIAKDTLGSLLEADPFVYDDHLVLHVKREGILEASRMVKTHPAFSCEFAMDATAVDNLKLKGRPERFDMVYHWYSHSKKHRVRIKAAVPESDPTIDSTYPVTHGLEWFEREVYDMYGITFNGHPDMRRILLYAEFEGFPLRKDHPTTRATPLVELRAPTKPQKTRWESIHGDPNQPMQPHPEEEAPGRRASTQE